MLLSLVLACRGPDPAPTEVETLLGWVLQRMGDEDTTELDEGLVNLDGWMADHLDQTLEGYEIDVLTQEQITALGVGDRELDGLHGIAVGYSFTSSLDQISAAKVATPTMTNEDGEVIRTEELHDCSREEFADGSCDWLDLSYTAHEDLALGVSIDMYMRTQYRRLESSLGTVLLHRSWSERSPDISTDLFSVDQLYMIWALLPRDGVYRSMSGEWVAAFANDKDLDVDLVYKLWLGGVIDREQGLDERAAGY